MADHAEQPRDSPWVAVVFETINIDGEDAPIYLCNRGPVVDGDGNQYDPRLTNLPILLGSSINATQYGEPVQAQPNGGVISFAIGDGAAGNPPPVWEWLTYHWQARKFSVYEGMIDHLPPANVDDDLKLVYVGYVQKITHDSFTVTVQTTDVSILLNVPLVTLFYDATFPVALQGRPKPFLWGTGFSLAPVLEQEVNQIYRVSSNPVQHCKVFAVRVGGVPWTQVEVAPTQGQWIDNGDGSIALGSPPLGDDVRCDATQGSYTVAGLLTQIAESFGLDVDTDAMKALDVEADVQASYWTSTNPINVQNMIGDFVNAAGCWWGINSMSEVTAGAIAAPDEGPSYLLTKVEINSLSLNTVQPLAWRIRAGYARNWQPETNFAPAVLQATQMFWSVPAQVFEPHYENADALTLEPLAVDVPLLLGTSQNADDAQDTMNRLVAAWGENRYVYDVTAFMLPDQIALYDIVQVEFLAVAGLFRIVGAVRAIGGVGPAQLQLWGIPGDTPVSAVPVNITVTVGNAAVPLDAPVGTVVATAAVQTSNGSGFTGTLTLTDPSGLFAINGLNIVTAVPLTAADTGAHTFTITATGGGVSMSMQMTM